MASNEAFQQSGPTHFIWEEEPPSEWQCEPRLVTFLIPLMVPFALPQHVVFSAALPETVEWLRGITHQITPDADPIPSPDGNIFVTIAVWRPQEQLRVPIEPLQAAARIAEVMVGPLPESVRASVLDGRFMSPDAESFGTVMEATTPLVMGPGGDSYAALDAALTRCLDELATFTRAYTVSIADPRVRPLTRRNAYPWAVFATRHPATFTEWDGVGLFPINDGMATLPAATSNQHHVEEARLRQMWQRVKLGDPLIPFGELIQVARRAFYIDGDYWAAVLAAYTAGEMLLNTVLLMMAWEEGTSRNEVRQWFGDEGFATRLRTRYHPRLGGNWGSQNPKAPMGRWETLSELRGRAVHAGFRPTGQQAMDALDTRDAVNAFVEDRLAVSRNRYPKTTLLKLGRFGLSQRGLYYGGVQRINESEQHDGWFAAYRNWFDSSV